MTAGGDADAVGRWLAVEQQADAFALPGSERLPAATVAQRAYAAGNWALADAAYKRAWNQGQIGPESASFR